MLADIERMQVESEGAHLKDEWIDERARDAQACVGCQRCAQRLKIVEKDFRRAICRQRLRELFLPLGESERRNRENGDGLPSGLARECAECAPSRR